MTRMTNVAPAAGPLRRLLRTAVIGAGLLAAAGTGAPVAAQTDEAAVLEVVTRLFDGMREKDEAKLRSVFMPEARLGTNSIDGFIRQVVGGAATIDEVTFDETVLIDRDLAMAWTPYNVYVDGTFIHCGVDLFVMRRIEGEWKILQLDDTRHSDGVGCDPERRG